MATEKVPPTTTTRRLPPALAASIMLAGIVVVALVSVANGHMPLSLEQIFTALFHPDMGDTSSMALWQIRLPRIMTALATGAALGLSGAVFQGLLLNPLADPYTLGVSSGAALGAALVIITAMLFPELSFITTPWAVTAGAFVMACLTLVTVVALAGEENARFSPTTLILTGVIVAAILSAALSFVKYLAGDQVGSIVFWLLGSFQARTWMDVAIVVVFFVPAALAAQWAAVDLNIMTMGVQSAETLGVDTRKVRLVLLASGSLAAAAAVSVAGIIGFVGLIVPHLVRMVCGPDHRSLLPLSSLGGALLLLCADSVVRTVLPGEIPVAVLTALMAGPAFLVIFRRRIQYAN